MFSEKDLLFCSPEYSILGRSAGGFAQRVFIVARAEPEHPGTREFLTKVLTAAGLNLEKDALFVEIPIHEQVSVLPVLKEKHAEYILVFGLPLPQIGIHADIPFYQPHLFYGATILSAEALSLLEPDKTRKGKLWQALQQMFT